MNWRLFMSVDLVGSTAYKNNLSPRDSLQTDDLDLLASVPALPPLPPAGEAPGWTQVFRHFYETFPQLFAQSHQKNIRRLLDVRLRPRPAKLLGDEVLLESEVSSVADVKEVVDYFAIALNVYTNRLRYSSYPLSVKGTAWLASFPTPNATIERSNYPAEFIGPSMDTGFRLTKFATPDKLIVSVDLATVLLEPADSRFVPFVRIYGIPEYIYFERTETLKGVIDGQPYPIIWLAVPSVARKMLALERKMRGPEPPPASLRAYCASVIETIRSPWLSLPKFDDSTPIEPH